MKKLDPKEIENILALTPVQEGMLFHYLQEPQNRLYFEQLSLEIFGVIDQDLFREAWNVVIKTNDMLRVVFRWEKVDNPVQIVLKEHKFQPRYIDLPGTDALERKARLEEIKRKDEQEKFDLQEVPFRVTLCKIGEDKYAMIISNHHILFDGWSTGIILKEFFKAYHNFRSGKPSRELPVKPSFNEFIKWSQNQDKTKQQQFWREYLAGVETPTELPLKRRIEETTRAEDYSIILEEHTSSKLDIFVKTNRVTPASVFYTAWGVLLQKYCAGEDAIFGTTVSGRSAGLKGIEDMVGLFINTIPLRIQATPGFKLIDIVSGVEDTLQVREEFETTPLPEIAGYSTLGVVGSLFDTIVAIENYPLDNRLVPEGEAGLLSVHSYLIAEMTHYDLTVAIMPLNEIEINFSWKRGLFEKETIENLARHFKGIVQNILENPETALSQLEIISTEEKNRLLYDFNNTAAEYPAHKTIHQLFEEQAEKSPDHIALSVGPVRHVRPVSLSYRQLNRQSDRLAGMLIEKGVLADNIVAIMMERSIEMIIGIFGILKAGGAYLPIDPKSPQERIDYMLKDSGAKLLVTTNDKEGEKVRRWEGEKVLLEEISISSESFSYPLTFLPSYLLNSSNLAYIIYTSGSTGKPKGVMVEHRSIVNYIWWAIKSYMDENAGNICFPLFTPLPFDLTVTSIFTSLLSGNKIIIYKETLIDQIIEENRVEIVKLTPSHLKMIVEMEGKINSTIKKFIVGGESLETDLAGRVAQKFNKAPEIFNEYGPTEATVGCMIYKVSPGTDTGNQRSVPIGIPADNVQIFLLDKNQKPVPIGVAGEIYISGDGLARGYLNRPELTAEKFVAHELHELNELNELKQIKNKSRENFHHSSFDLPRIQHSILYRTGDQARFLSDGNIEFLGRIDNQVKIRGFRVELGEIENRLAKHPRIKEVVAVAAAATGNNIPHLCAYIVLKNEEPGVIEKTPDAAELREYLSHRLPDYMIPAHFFLVGKIPLTPNGKVDNKALQASNTLLGTGVEYVAPKSDIERIIAEVWKKLLGLDKVGIHDNFFDLGGNSLSIIRLNSRLKEALPDKKDISVVTLFNHPTVASLVRYLNREEQEAVSEIKAGMIKSRFESSKIEIAVIGMAGRFPGAKDIDEFWDNIKNGVESIRFFTKEQLEQLGVTADLINNPDYVPAKGALESKEYFDSFFFGYTPAEAEILDPQVRIFHECTWEALENAGYDSFSYEGAVGLYAGASPNPLWEISPLTSGTFGGSYSEIWNALQFSDKDYLSTRIAYKLDLKGPCVTIQTACSTSLVAVNQACWALVNRTCDIALAGGVSVTLQDEGGYLYQEGTIMSPDGHCRAFDAGAKGTVGGNGVGVVALKRLQEAEADGDTIYAVVKSFAINNDGRNKVGFTAPSSGGQSKTIRDALDMAGAHPESIGYIETHGTGTPMGDPIEIEGLKLAFNAAGSRKKQYCALGSIKTNIGHLDAAAGIAGFIKTALSLHHRFIPPSLHYKTPNPQIDFENSPFYVNTELKAWERNGYPLRAGVSSFGLGGTNVHVILEEYTDASGGQKPFYKKVSGLPKIFHRVVLLSAKTPTALDKISENLTHHFEQNPGIDLADASYTLQVGRRAFTYRKMLVCSDTDEAIRKLDSGEVETAAAKEGKHTVILMFSGQGSQYVNMGLDLYQNEPVFRRHIDESFELLKNIAGIDMKPVLYPADGTITIEEAEEKIFQFKYTTPIKFIFEYSLARLLMKWGINPDAMIGHSFGEYAAACLAGVFSLEDGLFLAALRGELMHGLPDGAMLSVPLPEKELKQRLTGENHLDIAAINGESLCIISGPVDVVNRFEEQLNREGHECLRLQVPKAGHSRMVEPMMAEFKQKIGKVKFAKPRIPFISCVSGTWITAEEAVDPGYWTRHLREPVRFADGLTTLFKEPNPVFLQASPGKGLILFINQHPDNKAETLTLSMVRHRKEPASDVRHTLTQIGRLWLHGCETGIHWPAFYEGEGEKIQRIPLPSYPFEHIHYPVNKDLFKPGSPVIPSFSKGPGRHELRKKTDRAEWFYVPSWERVMQPGRPAIQRQEQPGASPSILLFMDGWGLGPQLKERLEQGGASVIAVHMGTAFKKSADRDYTLNPSDRENYNELIKELETQGEMPSRVYHLWNLSRCDADKSAKDNVNEGLDRGFYSLLFLVQAIGKRNANTSQGISIEVVTGNALEVNGEEELCPAIAPVYGLCRVIPQEYPDIDCRCIDITLPLSLPPGGVIGEKQVRQLLGEFLSGSPDRVVAYRGDYRWVETFKPLRLEKPQPGALPLKEKGVYVITGGLGAIGLALAEYLAKTFKARLILTGRSD
ncbi:MAG: amino acid adenylation domain-containing protein, partial [Candidatus Aminicenantes bacterium]|nr:amino acid adenylation domain-containing protein [Candidatus Aminicenantes bacterium]